MTGPGNIGLPTRPATAILGTIPSDMSKRTEPSYIHLFNSGDLAQRVESLVARLANCNLCPRACHVNRLESQTGFCRTGRKARVASVCDHHGEEPAISGTAGSGTIFFSNCNLKCVFCQNHQISQNPTPPGDELETRELAERMLHLQNDLGCHNINLVSPSHVVPQILEALQYAIPLGLHLPLVYNTNAYDSLETLRMLKGVVDIYLPDIKYASNSCALKYSQARGYVEHARSAIKEMHDQVGNLEVDSQDVAIRGLIVRHLILPNDIAGSRDSLTWLAKEVSTETTVSVMAQYFPGHHAPQLQLLSRKILKSEYDEVVGLLEELQLENGWLQEMDSAENYQPDFDRQGHPFSGNDRA